jgi:hypothetical protein
MLRSALKTRWVVLMVVAAERSAFRERLGGSVRTAIRSVLVGAPAGASAVLGDEVEVEF